MQYHTQKRKKNERTWPPHESQHISQTSLKQVFKELGHAILSNFSTNEMAIALTKISKTIEELTQNTVKPRMNMNGQNSRGLKWIAFG